MRRTAKRFLLGWLARVICMCRRPRIRSPDCGYSSTATRRRPWPYGIAVVYAYRGDRDKAFEWLEKAQGGLASALLTKPCVNAAATASVRECTPSFCKIALM
jgi:hypothetical protein